MHVGVRLYVWARSSVTSKDGSTAWVLKHRASLEPGKATPEPLGWPSIHVQVVQTAYQPQPRLVLPMTRRKEERPGGKSDRVKGRAIG